MGRYIKYNKEVGAQLTNDLNTAYNDLKGIVDDIQSWVKSYKDVSRDKIYEEDSFWDDVKEIVVRTVTFDFRDAYKEFQKIMGEIDSENTNTRNNELNKELSYLKNGMAGLDKLINEFDVGSAFNLSEAYEDNGNIKIYGGGDGTSVIYYLDADGREVSLQELTNAFYTYAGMAMDGTLKAFLTAQENNVAFDAKYQQNVLDGVNANVGSIQAAGGFGVASQQDIIGVDMYLSEDINYKSYLSYDAETTLSRSTGAKMLASNMSVGSNYLASYTMTDYINNKSGGSSSGGSGSIPENSVPVKNLNIEEGTVPPPTTDVPGVEPGTDPIPVVPEPNPTPTPPPAPEVPEPIPEVPEPEVPEPTPEPTPDPNPDPTPDPTPELPPDPTVLDNGLSQREIDNLTREITDIADREDHRNLEINISDDYDDMARHKYESMDPVELGERRGRVSEEASALFNNPDKAALREKLSGYGYDSRDIDKIVQSEDATISAMIEGDQRAQMSAYAKEFAEKDGVTNFDTKYDDAQKYRNYGDNSSSSVIANRNNDPAVKSTRENYFKAKEDYQKASDEVNRSVDNVNESKDEIEKFKKEHGSDASKWTKDEVEEYKDKVEQYNKDVTELEKKQDELDGAKDKYEDAKEDYDDAKESFEKRIKGENEQDDRDLADREREENTVDVNVEDDEFLKDKKTNEASVAEASSNSQENVATNERSVSQEASSPVETSVEPNSEVGERQGQPLEKPELPAGGNDTGSSAEANVKSFTSEAPSFGEGGMTENPVLDVETGGGIEITSDTTTETVQIDQSQFLDTIPGIDAETARNAAAVEQIAQEEVKSFESVSAEVAEVTPQLSGQTTQEIEQEFIDNLIVPEETGAVAVPLVRPQTAQKIENVGGGDKEITIDTDSLMGTIENIESSEASAEKIEE